MEVHVPQATTSAEPSPSLASIAVAARTARGNPEQIRRLLDDSAVPIALLDGERRLVEVNRPARLLLRMNHDEVRRLRTEDLTPPEALPMMMTAWEALLTNGAVGGSYPLRFADGSRLDVVYWALAYAANDRHLVTWAPADWPQQELAPSANGAAVAPVPLLTAREREVLRLAAEGNSAPQIAERLVIGESTVKTHLANTYAKLGVPDRAAAVASAIRRGLID